MHEMGLATEIVRIVTDSIPADMAHPRVARVNLKVGKLAAVVPQSLLFCFEIAAKETLAEGAQLHIEEIAVSARCNTCRRHMGSLRTCISMPPLQRHLLWRCSPGRSWTLTP
jgi:hydrogenase nickel insertion protein HypA